MIEEYREDAQRGKLVMEVISEYFRTMTPQDKDRLMQLRLAEARGPLRNAKLLCEMTSLLLRARQINQLQERSDVDQSNL